MIKIEQYNMQMWQYKKIQKELLKKFKENPETYPREEFYNDLQVYYAKNKGKDAIQEILELL